MLCTGPLCRARRVCGGTTANQLCICHGATHSLHPDGNMYMYTSPSTTHNSPVHAPCTAFCRRAAWSGIPSTPPTHQIAPPNGCRRVTANQQVCPCCRARGHGSIHWWAHHGPHTEQQSATSTWTTTAGLQQEHQLLSCHSVRGREDILCAPHPRAWPPGLCAYEQPRAASTTGCGFTHN